MEDLASRYADDAHFLFIYTREAHPGEHYPPHAYYEQKVLHSRSFRERLGIHRTILVDSLQGRVHRVFGGVSQHVVDRRPHGACRLPCGMDGLRTTSNARSAKCWRRGR